MDQRNESTLLARKQDMLVETVQQLPVNAMTTKAIREDVQRPIQVGGIETRNDIPPVGQKNRAINNEQRISAN